MQKYAPTAMTTKQAITEILGLLQINDRPGGLTDEQWTAVQDSMDEAWNHVTDACDVLGIEYS